MFMHKAPTSIDEGAFVLLSRHYVHLVHIPDPPVADFTGSALLVGA